jgi:hypothetical protein
LTGEPSSRDEARIGQKNGQVRHWARRGTRPRQPADQRYENAYLFGAICLARGAGAALALPHADTEAMQLHLDEISRHVAEGAHVVLQLRRAGWHTTRNLDVPNNVTPILLPLRAPELNPVENVWQYLRSNWLSNRVFDTYGAIVQAACEAWQKLVAKPDITTSIGMARMGSHRSSAVTFGISSTPFATLRAAQKNDCFEDEWRLPLHAEGRRPQQNSYFSMGAKSQRPGQPT